MFLQICHTPDLELAFLDKKYVSVYSIIGNYPSWKVLEQELFSHNFESCDSWNFWRSLVSWIVCFKLMDIYIKGVNRQTKVTETFFTQSGKEKERIFANKWEDNSSSRYREWLKTLVWTADVRKREFSNNWTKKIMGKKGFFKKK